ncbi:CopG family transcriptional regulator [Streptomyces sp. MS19]|uniref:ribbon-helix-helix domain-containing protein n=1 Tax=Streptomyces sp. MS19 TaxID=3385972 RepID=UPI0039A278FE
MPLKHTTVHVDTRDLVLIEEAAARRGVSRAEIIREGVRIAARLNRVRDEPPPTPTRCGDDRA